MVTKTPAEVWRGSPVSDTHQPIPTEIVTLFNEVIEDLADAVALAGGVAAPNPTYWIDAGQSNADASDSPSSSEWPGEADRGLVSVYVPASDTWSDVVDLQGEEPFNTDGSNAPAVHAALHFARRMGTAVRIVRSVHPGTALYEWTGGGYDGGTPIDPADRTISASNRAMFKLLTDAVTAQSIEQFHVATWFQGEADYRTPDDVYYSEMEYLIDQFKALGTDADDTRHFPTVVYGTYTGDQTAGGARRTYTLERLARENPDRIGFAVTEDLDLASGASQHFDGPSITVAGKRAGAALLNVWFGSGVASDQRLSELVIPPIGPISGHIGHRSWEHDVLTDETLDVLLVDEKAGRGETYRFSGACTLNLDPDAAGVTRDGGARLYFYHTSDADSLTITSDNGVDTKSIWLHGADASVAGDTGLTISGAGSGVALFQFNRWVLFWEPLKGLTTGELDAATDTVRRKVSAADIKSIVDNTVADFYEEGTLTPTLADAETGGNAASMSYAACHWSRTGNRVTANYDFTDIDTTGMTAGNQLWVQDLPFDAGASNGLSTALVTARHVVNDEGIEARLANGGSAIDFHQLVTGAGGTTLLVSEITSGSADLRFTISYMTDVWS